jgi:hypothetical protein
VGASDTSKIKFSSPSVGVYINPGQISRKLRFSIPENTKRKYFFKNRLTTQPNRPRLAGRGWEQAARLRLLRFIDLGRPNTANFSALT